MINVKIPCILLMGFLCQISFGRMGIKKIKGVIISDKKDFININFDSNQYYNSINAFDLYAEDELVLASPNMKVYTYGADGKSFSMQGNYEVHMIRSSKAIFLVSVVALEEWKIVEDVERISEYASIKTDIELYSRYGGSISNKVGSLITGEDLYPSISRWYRNETYSFLTVLLGVGVSLITIPSLVVSLIKFMRERNY